MKKRDTEHRQMVAAMLVAPLDRAGEYPAEQVQILRQRIGRALANEYKRGVYSRDCPPPERSQAASRGWKTRKDNERRRKKIELDRLRVRGLCWLSAMGLLPERVG